jgi:hypothetical protein
MKSSSHALTGGDAHLARRRGKGDSPIPGSPDAIFSDRRRPVQGAGAFFAVGPNRGENVRRMRLLTTKRYPFSSQMPRRTGSGQRHEVRLVAKGLTIDNVAPMHPAPTSFRILDGAVSFFWLSFRCSRRKTWCEPEVTASLSVPCLCRIGDRRGGRV